MGCDSTLLVNGKVEVQNIVNCLVKNGYINVCAKNVNADNVFKQLCGFIDFEDGNDRRNLFYNYNESIDSESRLSYLEEGVIVENDYTWLNLGYLGNSCDILVKLACEFGGYVRFNDCDRERDSWIKFEVQRG